MCLNLRGWHRTSGNWSKFWGTVLIGPKEEYDGGELLLEFALNRGKKIVAQLELKKWDANFRPERTTTCSLPLSPFALVFSCVLRKSIAIIYYTTADSKPQQTADHSTPTTGRMVIGL